MFTSNLQHLYEYTPAASKLDNICASATQPP